MAVTCPKEPFIIFKLPKSSIADSLKPKEPLIIVTLLSDFKCSPRITMLVFIVPSFFN